LLIYANYTAYPSHRTAGFQPLEEVPQKLENLSLKLLELVCTMIAMDIIDFYRNITVE
jgi:hypothetical protein